MSFADFFLRFDVPNRLVGKLVLAVLAIVCQQVSIEQKELRAEQLDSVRDALRDSYTRLVAVKGVGNSETRIDDPRVPPQRDTFTFFFNGPAYELRKKIGGFEFIQSYNGEYSQSFEGKRSRLEVLNNPRLNYLITLPHLQAFEWLRDESDSSLHCHDLLSRSIWEKRFSDANIANPKIQKTGEVIVEFPNKQRAGLYRVHFMRDLNFAIHAWELVENSSVVKTLEVTEHAKISELNLYLPSSVSLKANGVVAYSKFTPTSVNDQVSEKVADLRPEAKEVYDEFEIMKHVEEVRAEEKILMGQNSGYRPYRMIFLTLLTFACVVYLMVRKLKLGKQI